MSNDPGARPSGLHDPVRAVRSAAAAALSLEALTVLLALAPIAKLGGGLTAGRVAAIVSLSVLLVVTAALLKRPWAYLLGSVLQLAVLAAGLLTPGMYVIGVAFGLVWIYVLHLRRTVAGVRGAFTRRSWAYPASDNPEKSG